MKMQSIVGAGALVASLLFSSGAAVAGGVSLPAGNAAQSAALPGFSTATPSSSAALPAMPASGSSFPAVAQNNTGSAAGSSTLPGLDGLSGKQVNAIRPIRIPPGNNLPIPLPISPPS